MSDTIQPDWIDVPWWEVSPSMWGIAASDPQVLVVQLALANKELPAGHPLKITREDVRSITRMLELACTCGVITTEDGQDWDTAHIVLPKLAAKLAALLPPD